MNPPLTQTTTATQAKIVVPNEPWTSLISAGENPALGSCNQWSKDAGRIHPTFEPIELRKYLETEFDSALVDEYRAWKEI